MVAHDLRNPLTAIDGYVQLIGLRIDRGQLGQDEPVENHPGGDEPDLVAHGPLDR